MVSQHALQVVSQHALQQVSGGGGWYPSLQISRPTPKGKVEGIWPEGGVSRSAPKGEVEGDLAGEGVSRPTPKGEVEEDLARGGLQAHTWGVSAPGGVETPRDGYCCGRYASYWNAFLYNIVFGEE